MAINEFFGEEDQEFYREVAETECKKFLQQRGWSVGKADPKSRFDLFATKDNRFVKFQVKSTKVIKSGNPEFRTGKVTYNSKIIKRTKYEEGDFDFWFFYCGVTGESWVVPYRELRSGSATRMNKKFEKWRVTRTVGRPSP